MGVWGGGSERYNHNLQAPSQSCEDCPTSLQIMMYLNAENGVYWDNGDVSDNGLQTFTCPDNKTLNKGVWLKKKINISGFDTETAKHSEVVVYFSKYNGNIITSQNAKTIRTNGDYFFLPAISYYKADATPQYISDLNGAYYWSSSPAINYNSRPYSLFINSSEIRIGTSTSKNNGCLPMVAE